MIKKKFIIIFLILVIIPKIMFIVLSAPPLMDIYFSWVYTEHALERVFGTTNNWDDIINSLIDFYEHGF